MKKLNNKGYMLVEIIIASVMALVIACFLIDITVKLVNKNNDYYLDSVLLADKNIITKEIMDDINDSDLNLIDVYQGKENDEVVLTFNEGTKIIKKKLDIKDENGEVNISYSTFDSTFENEEEIMVYKRTFNSNLNVGDIVVKNDNISNLLYITIPAYTNYSDENYGINLAIKYDKIKTNITIPELPVSTIEETVPGCYEHSLSAGQYLLEVWGAQGGSLDSDELEAVGTEEIGHSAGGLGGYSYGTFELEEKTTVYICVGGQPESDYSASSNMSDSTAGGFNGGGEGGNYCLDTPKWKHCGYGQGGGGASDIRIGTDSLYARVIVAGGGSGGNQGETGHYGGGHIGGIGDEFYVSPADQTSAYGNGEFGVGGSCASGNEGYGCSGGGGGWYGGTGGEKCDDNDGCEIVSEYYKGSGGSGYVYTSSTASNYPSGGLLNSSYYLTDAATIGDGTTTFTDFNGSTVTGHSGNGAARITLIQ